VTITCAAVDDVTAWCLLALVVAVARLESGHGHLSDAAATIAKSAIYVGGMFLLVKPALKRLEIMYQRQGRLSQNVVSIIFLLILASSYATEKIGIHALFGAFLMGAIMPKGTHFVRQLSEKLEDYTVVFLLPIFFAATGLRTQIGLINNGELWFYTGLIILCACAGKFGGSALAARLCGMGWRESSAIGILMNTRGLMELVILNVGKELGVISDSVFAMMVIMALATTAMTTPILHWVYPPHLLDEERRRRSTEAKKAYSILIPVSLPKSGGPLVQMADMILGREAPAGRLLALHLHPPIDHAVYRSGLDQALGSQDESLAPLLAQARARGMEVEPLSFMSRDIPGDIATIAKGRNADLVLMGYHQPVIGKNVLGGTVHRVLSGCETNVAIFVDRGFRQASRILVPFLGSSHDRLALDLAARMARHIEAQVVVLHIVQPMRSNDGQTLGAKKTVERIFQDSSQPAPVTFRVVEDISPVGVVLHQAQQFDLVVIGVAEEWGVESHLFGWRPERIARDCPCSLLVVRQHAPSPAPSAPPQPASAAAAPTPPATQSP
jgi:nucleotide-binding universal stress UspA family protein